MNILVVDDSKTTLKLIANILDDLGYDDVTTVNSAGEALDVIARGHTDVVLLDWYMPKMNGIELLNVLKDDEKTRKIPILMVTVEDDMNMVKDAIDSGAEGYLVKPINRELLKMRLRDIESSHTLGLKK